MSEIIRAHNVYEAISTVVCIFGVLSILLGSVSVSLLMLYDEDDTGDKSIKPALLSLVVFAGIFLSAAIATQFYPNDREAIAMMEALAADKGIDTAPYIKIIKNEDK